MQHPIQEMAWALELPINAWIFNKSPTRRKHLNDATRIREPVLFEYYLSTFQG